MKRGVSSFQRNFNARHQIALSDEYAVNHNCVFAAVFCNSVLCRKIVKRAACIHLGTFQHASCWGVGARVAVICDFKINGKFVCCNKTIVVCVIQIVIDFLIGRSCRFVCPRSGERRRGRCVCRNQCRLERSPALCGVVRFGCAACLRNQLRKELGHKRHLILRFAVAQSKTQVALRLRQRSRSCVDLALRDRVVAGRSFMLRTPVPLGRFSRFRVIEVSQHCLCRCL